MISLIIPTYNHAQALEGCLQSIARQTISNLEVIIVDDGSTDAPAKVVQHWQRLGFGPITFLRQEHLGAPAARNLGARHARGEFLLFADADLILYPAMLERLQAALVSHPEAAYAYSSFRLVWKKFSSRSFDEATLRRQPYIHTSALIRQADFPGFDEGLRRFQDWDLWLTMLEAGRRGVYVPEVLFRARVTRRGMSTWRPRVWYWFWRRWSPAIGWAPRACLAYEDARARIRAKHHLP